MRPLFSYRPQQPGEKPVDLIFHLNKPACSPPPMPAQGLCDKSQADPFVGLEPTHCTLRKKDQVTTLAGSVVEQLHQIHAMARDPITNCVWGGPVTLRSHVAPHRVTIFEIQLAEGLEILLPLVDEIGGHHHYHRAPRTADGHVVSDGQRNVCLAHANLVAQDHAGLAAQTTQNLLHLGALAFLVRLRHAVIEARAQHQLRRRTINVVHSRHRSTTRFQKRIMSSDMRP